MKKHLLFRWAFALFGLIGAVALYQLYTSFKKETVELKIDSSISKLDTSLHTTLKYPYAMKAYWEGNFDDTILLDGRKIPPPSLNFDNERGGDFYGGPVRVTYDRYKATQVSISIKFEFFE